jgi:hypothetical protein
MKELSIEQEFWCGDVVVKDGGDYWFSGVVRAAFVKGSGVWRYAVENEAGLVHIFSGTQLRLVRPHVPRIKDVRRAKGGKARAAALSPERRSEIAKTAANIRWSKST